MFVGSQRGVTPSAADAIVVGPNATGPMDLRRRPQDDSKHH
jgi:hypothetical protein